MMRRCFGGRGLSRSLELAFEVEVKEEMSSL
jgi:hypothetical protein